MVGSPDYFAKHGKPKNPRDLKDHRCINTRWATDGSVYRWEFERGTEKLEVAVTGSLIVNEPEVAVQAAVAGVGLAFVFRYQLQAALAAGKLIPVLKDWTARRFPGFYLYYPGRRQMPPALRAFVDFIGRPSRSRTASSGRSRDPVRHEKMGVRAPAVQRRLRGIVARKVVVRQLDRHIGADVARIFIAERGRVVFQMVEHIKAACALGLRDADPFLIGMGEDLDVQDWPQRRRRGSRPNARPEIANSSEKPLR